MKRILTAVPLLLIVGTAASAGDPPARAEVTDPGAPAETWICTADVCHRLDSRAEADAAAAEAGAEDRPAEIVIVTAPAPSPWSEWEFRDAVYDDWDYRDPTDY